MRKMTQGRSVRFSHPLLDDMGRGSCHTVGKRLQDGNRYLCPHLYKKIIETKKWPQGVKISINPATHSSRVKGKSILSADSVR